MSHLEINCPGCGSETLLRREPVYEGFTKTGEKLFCAECGHAFDSEEEIPYKDASGPAVFSDADKPRRIDVFDDDEKARNCRYCVHYVVNPFIQRCGLHHREVAATDLCDDFERKPEDEADEAEPEVIP